MMIPHETVVHSDPGVDWDGFETINTDWSALSDLFPDIGLDGQEVLIAPEVAEPTGFHIPGPAT